MDNFDDPNESQFSGFRFADAKTAVIPGVGVVLRLETLNGPTAPQDLPHRVFQVFLKSEEALTVAAKLRHSAETAIQQARDDPDSVH